MNFEIFVLILSVVAFTMSLVPIIYHFLIRDKRHSEFLRQQYGSEKIGTTEVWIKRKFRKKKRLYP